MATHWCHAQRRRRDRPGQPAGNPRNGVAAGGVGLTRITMSKEAICTAVGPQGAAPGAWTSTEGLPLTGDATRHSVPPRLPCATGVYCHAESAGYGSAPVTLPGRLHDALNCRTRSR